MTPFSIRRAIVTGYIIALAIISFFALYTYLIMQKGEADYRRLNETLQSLKIIENIFDDVQNIESGQRGYTISGEKSFLEPYYTGLSNIHKDSLALLQLKTSDKRKTDITQLLDFIRQKIQFAETSIQLTTAEGLRVPEKSVQSDKGRVLMNNIYSIIHKIEEEERAVLNKYNDQRNKAARQTVILFFILALLFFLFLLSFFFFVRGDVKRRLNSELKSRVNEKTDAFKNILDRISDGFVALDTEWRYVYMNSSAASMLGKKTEELLNKSVWNLFPEAVGNEFYQACHLAMEKQEYIFQEVYHPGFDTWFENHIYPSPAGLSIHFCDITGKKKTELKLAEISEKLNLVAKATNDILWEADLVKQTVWWNDNFYEKFGYDRNEIERTGKSWENYLHPGDKERVLREVGAIIEDTTQTTWIDEYRFIKADGSYINVYDRCYILRNASGKAYKMIGSMADLTFLFETKKELQRTEERYKSLVDSVDGIVWEAAPDTFQFSFVSKQAERLLGYPVEQWTAEAGFWKDHIHPDDRGRTVNYCIENTRKMQSHEFEYRMIAADGRIVWLRDIVSVTVENDKPALLRGLMVDITGNKEAENALRNSEDKYRTLVEQATDGIFIADTTGHFIIVNSSGCQMSQYSEKELKTMTIYDLTDPEDLKNNPFHFNEMSGERGARVERKMRKKDGNVVDIEVNAKFLPDGRFLAFIRDITERKKAVEELKASEENRRLIMDAALDAIICIDTSGMITVWSTQAVNIFGWQKEEVIGKRLSETIIPQRYRAMHEAGMKKYLDLGEGPILNKLVEISALNNKGKEFPVELSIMPVKQGNTEFFCAFVRDITGRKQVEQKLIQSNERFELISRATHDAIWEWNLETGELWANDVHQQLYGLTRADPVPSVDEWMHRIHPQDRDKIVSAQDMALTSDQNYWESEYRFQKKDGNYVILFDRAYIIRNQEGKPIHLTGSMIDISERKRAEMEIIKARDIADKLIDTLPGVFYFFDKDGKFIRWNTQFERVTGYSSAEIAKMHPSDFFEGEDKTYIIEKIKSVFEKGMDDAETNLTTKSGDRISYYFKAVMLNYEGGPCLLGSGIDISERKKAEGELRISEKKYRSLVEQAADAIFIFDSQGHFVDVNSVSSELLGHTKEELLSMNLADIVFKEDLVNNPIHFLLLDKGESVIRRRNFRRKSGAAVTVEVHSKKLMDGRYLGMVRNLTERIETEKKLEKSFEAIRLLTDHIQNIREEERTHMAREIHDQLGQQLTVLKMDVSWLSKKIGSADRPVIEKIKNLNEMLDATVKTVRRISSELRPSLLDDLGLGATIDWHLKEFGNRLGLKTFFIEPEKEMDLSDSIKTGLFRIFQESLTNIARHSEAQNVTVSLQHMEDVTILSIRDDGKGFEQEKIGNKKTLGILGMRERSTMMGGTYETISLPGQGTTVIVSVPLKPEND